MHANRHASAERTRSFSTPIASTTTRSGPARSWSSRVASTPGRWYKPCCRAAAIAARGRAGTAPAAAARGHAVRRRERPGARQTARARAPRWSVGLGHLVAVRRRGVRPGVRARHRRARRRRRVAALEELSRVAKPGAAILISVPLHPERWNAFDDFVGTPAPLRPGPLDRHPRRATAFDRAQRGVRHAAALLAAARSRACGGSPTSASARCGGTTACSCRSGCSFRRTWTFAAGLIDTRTTSTRSSWSAARWPVRTTRHGSVSGY